MGIISNLLLLPVMGPAWGFRLFVEQLHEEAQAELHDDGRAFADLIELSMRRSAGQISDEEFADEEAQLLERLSAMQQHDDFYAEDDELLDERWTSRTTCRSRAK